MKQKNIYIEPETIQRAAENSRDAIKEARETIKNGSPEEIRAALHKVIEASGNYRAFLCANYHI